MIPALHELFRENGRSTHCDPATLAALGERIAPGVDGAQGAWFAQYICWIRVTQKRSIGAFRPEEHPELMLFHVPPPAVAEENTASIGPWIMALIIAIAVLLVFLSRC